jgi:hypothetical protein
MHSFRFSKANRSAMKAFLPVAAGLLVAQAIGTVFVFCSNLRLHAVVTAVEQAGYVALPNGKVAATLHDLGPAVWGGLFFTLSVGTGLTLATWAAILAWDRTLKRQRTVLAVLAAVWVGSVVAVNFDGATVFPSLFCCLVPLATARVALKVNASGQRRHGRLAILPVITLVLLTALWATQFNKQLFASIRDHVLLSNAVGRTVNDFYYRYTLYAAEAFKSFGQKTIRTAQIKGVDDAALLHRMERQLARNDVIPVTGIPGPDITMTVIGNGLRLEHKDERVMDTTLDQFMADPANDLRSFSRATDRFGPFRTLTLIGLLVGFPILLFLLVYGIAVTALTLCLEPRRAIVGASCLCLFIGILLFLPMLKARPLPITTDTLSEALSARQWPRRVAALRYIAGHGIEMARYPQIAELAGSPLVVERYWLARALAGSRASATYGRLVGLAKDPHPNVVCQAYYALGQHGRKTAVAFIQTQMAQSNHWYTQWYGYRALRKLGWHQNRSHSIP